MLGFFVNHRDPEALNGWMVVVTLCVCLLFLVASVQTRELEKDMRWKL